MLKIKTFKLDDYEQFNKFREKFSPRGENGIRYTTNHIIMTYEDGEMMTKSDKIQSLKFELGSCLEKEMQYDKQIRKGRIMRDSFSKGGEQYNQMNAQFNASIGMLKVQIMETKVVIEMLAELGEKIEVEHATLPDFEKDEKELIPSDIHNDKGRSEGKGKHKK